MMAITSALATSSCPERSFAPLEVDSAAHVVDFQNGKTVTRTLLSRAVLAGHLVTQTPEVRALVFDLRQMILKPAPRASEAVKFDCLCYYDAETPYGSIGGNI